MENKLTNNVKNKRNHDIEISETDIVLALWPQKSCSVKQEKSAENCARYLTASKTPIGPNDKIMRTVC